MTLVLDERQAPRGIAYAHMKIPVSPGAFTLDYPEWIPGEHGPTGPLHDLAELRISAGGRSIAWQRDQTDMYAFHIAVPPGVHRVNVDCTVLINTANNFVDGHLATRNIMVGNWNRYFLYQRDIDNTKYYVRASLILPSGWDFASALPVASRSGDSALQHGRGVARKCTLCYDRQKVALTQACAKACPTDSIQFGDIKKLKERAAKRVEELRGRGLDA